MNLTEFNKRLRNEVSNYTFGYRKDTAAFLTWFLTNVYCLDEQTAIDHVCDGGGDKGIDAIWVDEENQGIYLFQSEFSPKDNKDCGDSKLKQFAGVKSWFSSETHVQKLLSSTARPELKSLIETQNIGDKVANNYDIKLVYVTNKIFDKNANEFFKVNVDIEGYDNNILYQKYTYISEAEISNKPKTLNISNTTTIEYNSVPKNKAIVLSIPASEIIKLDGIQDHTLFSRNVRYWAGNTRVNKAIKDTLLNNSEHPRFFLYHNGITIVCSKFNFDKDKKSLFLQDYQVINGCQSILSFFENSTALTNDIMVLTKIVQAEPHNPIIKNITNTTNNQNAISLKDLKSDDRIQIGLQNEFFKIFNKNVLYKRKKGEDERGYSEVIEFDFAAQLLLAFYLKEPYNTHLKTKMFSDRYYQIFSRNINPFKIYLVNLIFGIIEKNISAISSPQVQSYGLAKFSILRFLREILGEDKLGKEIIENPKEYLSSKEIMILIKSIERLFKLVALDINAYIDDYVRENKGFFDYKNLFKNRDFVEKMNTSIITAHKKGLVRHSEDSFSEIYKKCINERDKKEKKK